MTTVISGDASADFATPLPVTEGGTGSATSRPVAQVQTFSTGALATGTTIIPKDDTIPQITEGDQYMALSITPTSTTSLLEVDVTIYGACTEVSNAFLTAALFLDSNANAVAAGGDNYGANSYLMNLRLRYYMTSGSLSTKTFSVRMGGTGGTTTFNGQGGSRVFGGVMASNITIKEYL